MHKDYICLWLCIAIVTLGCPGLIDAEDVVYNKCSLTVKSSDDGNLAAKLMCGDVEVLKDTESIVLGTKTPVLGTPITFFPDDEHLVEFDGNAEGGAIFEVDKLVIENLPEDLGSLDYLFSVKDARLRISNSEFDLDKLSKAQGVLNADATVNDAVDPSAVPETGPVLILDQVSIVGGSLNNGALNLMNFPYLSITGGEFQHGEETYAVYIMLDGKTTLFLSKVKCLGGAIGKETTVMKGSGEATVFVEDSTFTNVRNTVLDWGEGNKAASSFHFKTCTFTDNKGAGVANLKTPLTLTMEDCTVTGSRAKKIGGVFEINVLDPSDLLSVHLKKTTFRENQAPEGSVMYLKATGSDPKGDKSEVKLEDCTVEKNTQSTAIRIIGSDFVDTTILGGSFIGNVDFIWGGALGLQNAGKVLIQGATFKDNIVDGKATDTDFPCGGAIHVQDMKSMEISGCTFENNKVIAKEEGMGGGAVFVKSEDGTPTLTVSGTTFSNNFANNIGGSLLLDNLDAVEMSQTTFESSSTDLGSGGAATLKNVKTISATNLTVKGSSGRQNGGGLAISTCSEVRIKSSHFLDNSLSDPKNGAADDEKPTGGSALSIESTTPCVLEIEGTQFEGKSSYGSGGLLLVSDSSTCSLSGSTFKQNGGVVNGDGGVAKMECSGGIIIDGCTFVGGGAANGGALAFKGSKVEVSASHFEKSIAVTDGGALYLITSDFVKLTETDFVSNRADKNAGAVSISSEKDVTVKDCDFTDNIANKANGGGVYIVKGKILDITGGKYIRNSAVNGGAFFFEGSKVQVSESHFEECTATADGGALHLSTSDTLELTGTDFVSNKAKTNGAAVSLSSESDVTVKECDFTDNHAYNADNADDGRGGGVYILKGKSLDITGGKYSKNSAAYGGGIFTDTVETFTCTGVNFEDNGAGGNGGSILATGSTSTVLQKLTFTGCKATGDGACIHVSGSTPATRGAVNAAAIGNAESELEISGSMFSASKAKNAGAFLAKDVSIVSVSNTTIDGTSGDSAGGGLVEGATSLALENLHITDSKAEKGDAGGLKVISTKEMTITDSTFGKTKAEKNGGALVLESVGESIIEKSSFTYSTAGGDGGGIFLSGGEATITNSVFNHTKAKRGGALALDKDAQVMLKDTDILRSEATSLEGGVLMTLSCDSQASAGGKCMIDIPFKTGYDGMDNKEAAEEMAAMSADPNCPSSNIDMKCETEVWEIGGVEILLIAFYIFAAIMAILLILMLGSIAITHQPPKEDNDDEPTEGADGSAPLLPS